MLPFDALRNDRFERIPGEFVLGDKQHRLSSRRAALGNAPRHALAASGRRAGAAPDLRVARRRWPRAGAGFTFERLASQRAAGRHTCSSAVAPANTPMCPPGTKANVLSVLPTA